MIRGLIVEENPGRFWPTGLKKSAKIAAQAVAFLFGAIPVLALSPSMKLLSPTTGWYSSGQRLSWTTDGGEHWTDITPSPGVRLGGANGGLANLDTVFFLNESEGWATLSYYGHVNPADPLSEVVTVYSIAHTVNSGASWSIGPVTFPQLPGGLPDALAGPAFSFFLDSLHGWMDIAIAGNTKPGLLLGTADGGRTWNWVNSPNLTGPIRFSSLQDGFQIGYFGTDRFYATHDGCKSWQEIVPTPPPQVGAATQPAFQDAPVFRDTKNGYLVVHYTGPSPAVPSKLVVYSTRDAGRTWLPVKVLSEAGDFSASGGFPFAIVDSSIVVSIRPTAGSPAIATVPLDGRPSEVMAFYGEASEFTFTDATNGWVHKAGDGLFGTYEGGQTWKDITPPRAQPPTERPRFPARLRRKPFTHPSPNT